MREMLKRFCMAAVMAVVGILPGVTSAATIQYDGSNTGTSTLRNVIRNANSGDTIQLTGNVAETVTVNKELTIDLNGCTFTGASGKGYVLAVEGTSQLTIADSSENGTGAMACPSGGYAVIAIESSGAQVKILGGTYTGTVAAIETDSTLARNIYEEEQEYSGDYGFAAYVEIKGGTFNLPSDGNVAVNSYVYDGQQYSLAEDEGFEVTITGGTFSADPAQYGDIPADAIGGYYATTQVSGGYQVLPAVATVGTSYYANLNDAVAAAPANGTITLISDCTTGIRINSGTSVTVDLGGYTLTRTDECPVFMAGGTATFQNGAITATLTSINYPAVWVQSGSTVTLGENLIVNGPEQPDNDVYGATIVNGTVIVAGATINADQGIYVQGENSSAVLTSGTINATDFGIRANVGASISVTGGTIIADDTGIFAYDGSSVIVSGGRIEGDYGIGVRLGSSLTMSGGTVSATSFGIYNNGSETTTSTTIAITGGTVESIGTGACGIYQAGPGSLSLSGTAAVSGPDGIEVRAGTLNIADSATVTATADTFTDPVANGGGSTGHGGAAVIVSQHTTNQDISATISGGTLNGAYALYEADLQDTNTDGIALSVTGGTFDGNVASENCTGFVSGGQFSTPIDGALCADNRTPGDTPNESGYYTLGQAVATITNGATLNKYPTLQAAITAAQEIGGEVTVKVVDDISGTTATATIPEVANFKLTIDGTKGENERYTITDSTLTIDGMRGNGWSVNNGASVTLQNIDFAKRDNSDNAIYAKGYPHDVTIQNCSFTGTSENDNWWAINTTDNASYYWTLRDLEFELCRMLYTKAFNFDGRDPEEYPYGLYASNLVGTNVKVGIANIKTDNVVLIENCVISASKYAFRDAADSYKGEIILKNNNFTSPSTGTDEGAIVVRGGSTDTASVSVESGHYTGQLLVLNDKDDVLDITGGSYRRNDEPTEEQIAAEIDFVKQHVDPEEYSVVADEDGWVTLAVSKATVTHTEGEGGSAVTTTTGFSSLAAAIAAAGDGDTVKLLADSEVEEIEVSKQITLDLNGKAVTSAKPELFTVTSTGDLTITGSGMVTGPANGKTFDGKALIVVDGGTLLIEDGTFTATGEGSDGMYGVYVLKGGTATFGVAADGETAAYGPTISSWFAAIGSNNTTAPAAITVYGGSYTANVTPASSDWWSYFCAPVYAAANGSYNLQGGTFKGYYGLLSSRYENTQQNISIGIAVAINSTSDTDIFVDSKTGTAQEGEVTRTIASETNDRTLPAGYTWASDGNGGYVVAEAVASVTTGSGESATTKYFATLEEAIAAAVSGDTVALLADYTMVDALNIIGKSLDIDLGGNTLKITANVNSIASGGATTTIKNGVIDISGAGATTGSDGIFNIGHHTGGAANGGNTINLSNVTLTGTNYYGPKVFRLYAGCALNIEDSTVELTNCLYTSGGFANSDGSNYVVPITIKNSKVDLVNTQRGFVDGQTTIIGSTVNIVDDRAIAGDTVAKLDNGFNYNATTGDGACITITDSSVVTISGGTGRGITLNGKDVIVDNGSKLVISDMTEGDIMFKKGSADNVVTATNNSHVIADTVVLNGVTSLVNDLFYADATSTVPTFVAQIGNKPYTSLATAIEAAQAGDTVILLADTKVEEIEVSKQITLDLNGKTVSSDKPELFTVTSDGDLTITGNGTVTGPENGKTFDGKALIVVDGGTLLIEDGTFTATGEGSDGMYGVYVLKGGTATFGVAADGEDAAYGPTISSWFAAIGSNNTTAPAAITVYGGSYTANVTPASSDWWSYFCAPVYAAANGSYDLQGGTFKGYYGLLSSRYENTQQNISIGSAVDINSTSDTDIFVDSKTGTAQEGEVTRTIASETNDRTLPAGYTWASDDNGVYVVAEAVASVTTGSGESATTKYFATLKEAIAAAVSGDKVELLSDVTVGSTIEIIKSITIDGGEHTLTSGATRGIWIDAGDVNVTIKNLTVLAANTNTGFERAIQVNPDLDNVTLNIDNVTATSTAYCVNVCAGVDDLVLNITNSELTGWAALNLYGSGLTVNVSDSKLVGVNDKSYSSWNTFGVIVLEGDTTGNTTLHSSDYTVSIVDSEIVVDTTEQGNYQYAIIHNKQSESNVLKLDGCEITFGNDHCLFFNDASTGSVTMLKDTVASDTEQIPELSLYYVYVEGTGDYSGYTVIANTAALVVTEGENEDYEYTPYATLAEAVENAEDGGDVVLMANNTETVTVAKNLTIHKNGTSYTATRLTASPAFVSEETEDAYIFSSAKVTLTVGNVSTGYATLQAAVDAIGRGTAEATASGTIELLDNIVLTEPVRIPSTGNAAGAYVAVTINGNGKKISGVFDDSFNSFFSGLSSALADNVSLTVNNTAFQNTNANPESNWVKGFVATTEGTGTPTTDLHLAFNECTFTNFYTPVCVNPGTVAGDFTGRSLSITGCTYDNVNYGYSVDTSTEYNGSGYALAADKQIKITFTNNTGYDAVREMFEVAQVGDFVYKTFVKAATDAVANGGTLEILADLGENNEFTLPEGGALTVKVTDFEYAINPADGYTVASIKTVSDLDAATVTYSYITPVAQITRDGVTTKYPTLADAAADADDNDVIEIIGDYGTEELPAGWILDGANNRLFRAAAAIGDDLYPTVQEAFDDAVAGETVVLLKDSAPEDKALYVDVACTLDLNGHTLTAVILPNFDFTVVDTYEDDEGGANLGSIKLPVLAENGNIEGDTELDGAIWAWEGATVTVAGGTYDNPAVVLWTEGANVVIDGGVFETYAVVPDAETCAAATRKNRWDVEATVTVTDGEFNGNYLLGTHQYAKGATLNIEGGWFKAKDASVAQTIDSGTVTVSGGFFADEPVFVDEDHVSADNQDDETKAVYPYTVAAVVRTATITSVLVNDTTGTANITVALENWKSGTAVKLWAKVDYNDAYWAQVDEKTGTGEEITFLNVPVSFNTVYTATGESVTSGAFDRGANVVGALAVTLSSSEDCVIGVPYSEIGEFDTITVAQLFQNTTLQDGDTVYTLSNEYVWNASSREWEADDEDNIDQLAPGSAVVFYRKGGGTVRISGEVKAWTEKQPWEEDEVAWANSLDSDDGWNMAASVNPTALNVQDIPYVGLGDDDSLWITDSTGVFRELKWDGSQWYYSKKVYAGWDVTVTKVTDLTIEAGSAFWYVNND